VRRALLALAATVTLSACGAAPSATPPSTAPTTPSPSVSATTAATPAVLRVHTMRWRLPSPLGREAVVAAGPWATVAGGLVGGDSSTADSYRIDLADGRVRRLPALPVAVHDTAGAPTPGGPLVIGGGNAAEQDVVQRFVGGAWSVVGHLPQARSDLTAASVGGRILALGGYDGLRPAEPDVLASTDGRAWRTIGHLPVPVRYAATTVADGAVWLLGGEVAGTMQTAIQRVDPATGKARVVARLPERIGHAVALPFGNRILLAGGRTTVDNVTDRMWWFTPATGRVTPAGHLPAPLADSAAVAWHGAYYLLGGESPSVTDHVVEVTDR
jgi:N-acetylneuraminic acid mutarotase